MFFKRLSRSRSNSQSYVDDYHPRNDSKVQQYDDDDDYAQQQQQQHGASHQQVPINNAPHAGNMYSPHDQVQSSYSNPPNSRQGPPSNNSYGPAPVNSDPMLTSSYGKNEAAPDLLTRAFNEAIRPYTSKLDELEAELADLRAYVVQLETQRADVHAWIDKRGLRPDVPPSIASLMDATPTRDPTQPAATLNAQLDRKITIVNFDLHRLQDDLNDSLPTPSFSACMLKFIPDIARLSSLPGGPKYAFDLLLKLGGNLNSHGGLDARDPDDLRERRAFYGRLDDAMVDIVRGRFREEGDSWGVQREIKRIEKTGTYLKGYGVEPYFPRTLEVLHDGLEHAGSSGQQVSGGGGGTPPAYQ